MSQTPEPPRKSIARSLGEFFGHIARSVSAPVDGGEKREVRREVETETRDTPQGKVVLRRTIVEEVELPPRQDLPRE